MLGRPAARLGDLGVPHCSPFVIKGGSSDVLINNRPAARFLDSSSTHLVPARRCRPHTSKIMTGSSSVLVNNRPLARVGDSLFMCTKIATGSSDVFVG